MPVYGYCSEKEILEAQTMHFSAQRVSAERLSIWAGEDISRVHALASMSVLHTWNGSVDGLNQGGGGSLTPSQRFLGRSDSIRDPEMIQ